MAYAFYNDPTKTTNGQRFWAALVHWIRSHRFSTNRTKFAYFNISAPVRRILSAKLSGKTVIIRVAGNYHEKLAPPAIQAIENPIVRFVINVIYFVNGPSERGARLMNLLSHNYKLFIKILLSDFCIYQSEFSRSLWRPYFPNKPSAVILNGARFSARELLPPVDQGVIRVMTMYDGWRCAKRLHDLIQFIQWHNQRFDLKLHLLIVGYDRSQRPKTLTSEDIEFIEGSAAVSTLPPFTNYSREMVEDIRRQHLYVTFAVRDNCPNSLIEAMALGLPVVALNSGGIPQVVGDAGEIVSIDDRDGFFCSFDHSFDYPAFDQTEVSRAIFKIVDNYEDYCERVRSRFCEELDLSIVAAKYLSVGHVFDRNQDDELAVRELSSIRSHELTG